MRILSRQRQRVYALELTTSTFGIVTRRGNFRITHAVTDKQNHILGRFITKRSDQRGGLILSHTASATELGDIPLSGTRR